MVQIRVYLAGPQEHVTEEHAHYWRCRLKHDLEDLKLYSFFDPTELGKENCFDVDIAELEKANIIVVDLRDDVIKDGTMFEFGYAYRSKKEILCLGDKNNHPFYKAGSKWFGTLMELVNYLRT